MKILLAVLSILLVPNLLLAQDSPLTGAQVMFEKGSPLDKIDVLKKADAKKGQLTGTWSGAAGPITGGDKDGAARVMLGPADLEIPEEYDLTITVTRVSGDDGVASAFPTPGGGRGLLMLDYNRGQYGVGIAFVNGAAPDASGYGVVGALLKKGQPRTFTLMIRKEGIVIQVDGKDYFGKKLSWSSVTVTGSGDRPDQKGFCLSTWKSQVTVSQYKVSYPKPNTQH